MLQLAVRADVRVSDGQLAATFVVPISVSAVNDAPVVTGSNTPLSYTENDAAKAIFTSLTITDPDNTTLTSATISITTGFATGQDVLNFTPNSTNFGDIALTSYANGVLTLTSASGTATLAQWTAALKSVTYNNTSDNPSTTARTVSLVVNDGGTSNNLSTAITNTITVIAVNDAPTITVAPSSFTVTEDVAGNLTFTGTPFADVDSTSLTITLSVADGTISALSSGGITVGGTPTARTFSGTISALNTYFTTSGNITYQGALDANGAHTLTIQADDGSSANNLTSTTTTINITAVNDAPIVTTVTRAREPFLTADMLAHGAHLNAAGAIIKGFAEIVLRSQGQA